MNLLIKREKLSVFQNLKILIDNRFLNLDKLAIKTFNEGVKNNDFLIIFDKKIKISGEKFDANNLPKILKNKSKKNNFISKINRERNRYLEY